MTRVGSDEEQLADPVGDTRLDLVERDPFPLAVPSSLRESTGDILFDT